MFNWLLFLAVGKLFTWLIMTNGLLAPLRRRYSLIDDLLDCDLCTGFWVYTFIAYWFGMKLDSFVILRLPNSILLGAVSAFVAHVFSVGWHELYGGDVYD